MVYKLDLETEKLLKEKNIVLEKAKINDLDNIIELYSERMKWFKENEMKQWSKYLEHHPRDEYIKVIEKEEYFVLKENNNIIAGFELTNDSKYWRDEKTKAYYIYRLVIKVGYKNMGNLIFKIIKNIAQENDKQYIRLHCLRSNQKLNEIYQNHGFKLMGSIKKEYDYNLREYKIYE